MTTKKAPSFQASTAAVCLALLITLVPGTARAEEGKVRVGLLTAYTGTSTYDSGDIDYYAHTGYRIFHADGTFYRSVRNHTGPTDESPYRILLPVGNYFLLARSEKEGRVKVPIAISAGQWTVVRLDDPTRGGKIPPNVDVIRLSDGSVAGWLFRKRAPRGFRAHLGGRLLGFLAGN